MHVLARPELHVGVTGHRLNQLPEKARPRIRDAVARLLGVIEEVGESAGAGRFTLVSALAEGADRYAAHAALARRWALEAPLPFSVKRYEKDFATRASVNEFRALMKAARLVEPHGEHDGDDDRGYGGVGEIVAAQSQVLIALWNGAPPRGPGGTADVIRLALAAGAAVLWLAPDPRTPTRLLSPAPKAARKDELDRAMRRALAERFARVAAPAELAVNARRGLTSDSP